MSVQVYAATDPLRVEIVVDGVVFTCRVDTFSTAMRIAVDTCCALGLGRTAEQGVLRGVDLPTIDEPSHGDS